MKPCHNDPRTAIVMPLRILAIGLLVMVASVAASSAPETVMGFSPTIYANVSSGCVGGCASCSTVVPFATATSCMSDPTSNGGGSGGGPPIGGSRYLTVRCGAPNSSQCGYVQRFADSSCTIPTEKQSVVCGQCVPSADGSPTTWQTVLCSQELQAMQYLTGCANNTCTDCPVSIYLSTPGLCVPGEAENTWFAFATVRNCTAVTVNVLDGTATSCNVTTGQGSGTLLSSTTVEQQWCEGNAITTCENDTAPAAVVFPPPFTTPAPTPLPTNVTVSLCSDVAHCVADSCSESVTVTAGACVTVQENATLAYIFNVAPSATSTCFNMLAFADPACSQIGFGQNVVCDTCQIQMSGTAAGISVYVDCTTVPGSVVFRRGCDPTCTNCTQPSTIVPFSNTASPTAASTNASTMWPSCVASLSLSPNFADGWNYIVIESAPAPCFGASIATYVDTNCSEASLASVSRVSQYHCAIGFRITGPNWTPLQPLPPLAMPTGVPPTAGQTISAAVQSCDDGVFCSRDCSTVTTIAAPQSCLPSSALRPVSDVVADSAMTATMNCLPQSGNLNCSVLQFYSDSQCTQLVAERSFVCNTCSLSADADAEWRWQVVTCDSDTLAVTMWTNCTLPVNDSQRIVATAQSTILDSLRTISMFCSQDVLTTCALPIVIPLQTCLAVSSDTYVYNPGWNGRSALSGVAACAAALVTVYNSTDCSGDISGFELMAQSACNNGHVFSCSYRGSLASAYPSLTTHLASTGTSTMTGTFTTTPTSTTTTTTTPSATTARTTSTSTTTSSRPSTSSVSSLTSTTATVSETSTTSDQTTTSSPAFSFTVLVPLQTNRSNNVNDLQIYVTELQASIQRTFSDVPGIALVTTEPAFVSNNGTAVSISFVFSPSTPTYIQSAFASYAGNSAALAQDFGIQSLFAAAVVTTTAAAQQSKPLAPVKVEIIVGSVIGGVVAILLAVIIAVAWRKRSSRRSGEANTEYEAPMADNTGDYRPPEVA